MDDPSTVRTDLFALGSIIYEIENSEQPLKHCNDEEVESRFRNQQFPVTQNMWLGDVVRACWQCKYTSAQLVRQDILEVLNRMRGDDSKNALLLAGGDVQFKSSSNPLHKQDVLARGRTHHVYRCTWPQRRHYTAFV